MPEFQLGRSGGVEAVFLKDGVLERPEILELGVLGGKVTVDGDVDDRTGSDTGREEE